MKDGYYLSTYLHIGEISFLRRLNFRHDQNISLWLKRSNKVELVHYWEIERITGIKEQYYSFYNYDQAVGLINQLLKQYNLSIGDMQEVWGTPQLQTCNDYFSLYDYPNLEYHSVAHLFSSMLMDTDIFYNNPILSLAVDGGPDKVLDLDSHRKFYAGGVSKNGSIIDLFPISSPGYIWGRAAYAFGYKEGTLMALAGACKSRLLNYQSTCMMINDLKTTKGARNEAKQYMKHLIETLNYFEGENSITDTRFSDYDADFSIRDNQISMAMKEIQNLSIQMMTKEIDTILERYQLNPCETYLSLSGGYALNCPTNSYLMNKYKFKGFLAPPCVNDSGMSLGIALYAFYKKNPGFQFKLQNAYYGDADDRLSIISQSERFSYFISDITMLDYQQAVKDIIHAPIVWFNGRAEIGPRALGNRSLIADPRTVTSKDLLNKIKQRQWWRPVAPIILEEELHNWFENAYPSPFMLHTFRLKEDKIRQVPAIAHLDTSSRVQTVTEENNSMIYQLLLKFQQATQVPLLCNTSLNDRGEPIINRIEEAFNFALRKKIEIVYINGQRVKLHHFEDFTDTQCEKRPVDFFGYITPEDAKEKLSQWDPYNIPEDLLYTYLLTKNLHENFTIKNKTDIKALEKLSKIISKELIDYDDFVLK